MGTLYTIGHSTHNIDFFMSLLKINNINFIIDVRSMPYSKFADTYNKENIQRILLENSIKYFHMGNIFGARQNNDSFYTEKGYMDFTKVAASENFRKGVENVKLGLNQGNNIVFMCSEKDPSDCHRSALIARAFSEDNIDVYHILPNGQLLEHKELMKELTDVYFPHREQLTLFNFQKTEEEYLKETYEKINEKIGFVPKKYD